MVSVSIIVAAGALFWPRAERSAGTPVIPQIDSARPGSSEQATPAHQQAAAVSQILEASGESRSVLSDAVESAQDCADLDTAIELFEQVAQERGEQLDQAEALQLTDLPNGPQLRETLIRAIRASLDADEAYLAWARDVRGCTGQPPPTADYRRGNELSLNEAGPAKDELIELWRSIAESEGLPAYTRDEI